MSALTSRLSPSESLGMGPLPVLILEAQVRVNLFWPALLAIVLLPLSIELSSPQSSSGGVFVSFPQRPVGLVVLQSLAKRGVTPSPQPGNWFGGPSILAHFSCCTQGGVDTLSGPLMGAATFLHGTSVEAGGASLETEV